MRIKRILFYFSLFVFHFSLFTRLNAQQKTWAVEVAGQQGIGIVTAIVACNDGGFLVSDILRIPTTQFRTSLLKFDSTGNLQWTKMIGNPPYLYTTPLNYCNSIKPCSDGGYIMTGYIGLYGQSAPNVFVMKFDSAGNTLWSETIGGIRGDIGNSIIQTTDRGFAITGSASSFMLADTEVYVLKLDSIGKVQWTKTIGGTGDNEGYSIIQTKDGGYAITGKTNMYGAGASDVYLLKLDSGGNIQWTKTIGGSKNDAGNSIIQTMDGGYAITGNTYSFNDTVNGDVYAIKLDSNGNLQWTRTIGGINYDAGYSIFQTGEGEYVIGGTIAFNGTIGDTAYFIKLDSAGNLKETRTYAGPGYLQSTTTVQTKAGGFALAGYSPVSYYGTIYLLVLDSAGNNCEGSGSTGTVGSGGMVSSGGQITLRDSGRVEATIDTSITQPGFFNTLTYLCRNGNNSGGLEATPTEAGSVCFNDMQAIINISASGGISPYTYTWTPPVSDSSSAAGLNTGTYTILVTDPISDSLTLVFTVLNDPPFVVYFTYTNTTCSGSADGSISIFSVSSSNSPFSYSWSNGATTASNSGLSAGTYSVTVYDACADSGTALITIGLTPDFNDSAIVINQVSCQHGSDGSAIAAISGGTSPFTYQWSDANSQTTAISTGLSAGVYSVVVSDACGGSVTSSVAIAQPFPFSVSIVSTSPPCSGENNGSALASLTVPLIANFTMDTVVQHFLVPLGVNTVTLTMIGARGGSEPSYEDSASGGNGANFIGVCTVIPGHILSVVVGQEGMGTGGGGASWVYDSNIVLHSPSGTNGILAVAAGGGGASDWYGGNGMAHGGYVGGSGGINLVTNATTIGTFFYAAGGTGGNGGDSTEYCGGGAGWLSNGGSGILIETDGGMDEINHFRNASKGGGFGGGGGGTCHARGGSGECPGGGGGGYNGGAGYGGGGGSFFIDTLPIVTDSGTGNGFVRIEYTITGYDSTFTYSWSNGETTINATRLSAGTYSLTVTNSSGCSATTSVTITQPISALTLSADSSKDNGTCNGSAWAVVNGGNSPYTYSWNPSGLATDTITNQCSGDYCCTVTDANGCMESVCVNIPVSTGENARPDGSVGREKVKVFPNPGSGVFTFQLSVVGIQHVVSIGVYNILGERVYSQFNINSSPFNIDLSSQPDGIYLYRVLTENGELVGQGKVVIER